MVKTKKCTKCRKTKDISAFGKHKSGKDGIRAQCRKCVSLSVNVWNVKNKERKKVINKNWRDNNKERRRETDRKWQKKNKKRRNAYFKIYNKNWQKKNRLQHNKTTRENNKKRYHTDPLFKMKRILRSRLRIALKSKKWRKNSKFTVYIGCTSEELKKHMECLWQPGMSWENHSLHGWHIDHIIPLASAKTEEEMIRLCHYTNLQPLWKEDHNKKTTTDWEKIKGKNG